MAGDASAGAAEQGRAPSPVALLFVAEGSMARQAAFGRARWYFVFAWVCSILLGAALAYRVDARSATLEKLEKSEQLQTMSDRQVAEETTSAERVAQVKSIAGGVFAAPVSLGLACLSIVGLSWFLRGKLKGAAVAPVAGATLLPGAIANLLDAGSALQHATLPPEGAPLVPRTLTDVLRALGHALPDPWWKLGNALDFFSLWSALMLGFGLVAAGQLPRRRAIVGAIVAWLCYRLLTQVAAGGGH